MERTMYRGTNAATRFAREQLYSQLDEAIRRSRQYFLRTQRPEGFWHAPLEANATMDAEYIFFNRFMGRKPEAIERRIAERLLATQAADGSWALYHGGPGHLSTTIEAYFALKLTGGSADEPAMRRAREFILVHGGLAKAGIFTRTFLAYFGQFPWTGLPAMPVEVVLLPPWFPINIYALSSWARGTVVPLTILMAKHPSVRIDDPNGVGELWATPSNEADLGFPPSQQWLTWRNFFLAVDKTLKFVGRSPWKPLRNRALRAAERWILSHQDVNGGWGGIQPAMINSVMALRALGYRDEHPAVAKGIQAIDDFLIEHDGQLLFQPCVSPTWDTALACKALLDSGLETDHPALARAADWLIANQIFKPGDWSIYNPGLDAGGWAFEFANDWYPDVDDSAVILLVLKRIAGVDVVHKERAIAYGLNWTLGMQSRNGGYGAFDTDNDSAFLNQIPFADMEAMIDPPTEDLTGRLLELMGNYGFDLDFDRARRAQAFVMRTQRPDGSWWGRWGANFIYGTWSVLAGLRAIGENMNAPHVRRAVAWLKAHQHRDGGWGESLRSYDDEREAGRGESTPSQTAWAILGLLAGEHHVSPELLRGLAYLVEQQSLDGTWPEAPFTGTGFPRHFYLRYHMYRNYFPLMALGSARARLMNAGNGNGKARRSPAQRDREAYARGEAAPIVGPEVWGL
ncbi:MAG TPA: squalene--hopene cyclase [Candidatus Kryptonia bacterium]|nr:squalene--hopene cyclase [Candidatus Kryptonia bacterium]